MKIPNVFKAGKYRVYYFISDNKKEDVFVRIEQYWDNLLIKAKQFTVAFDVWHDSDFALSIRTESFIRDKIFILKDQSRIAETTHIIKLKVEEPCIKQDELSGLYYIGGRGNGKSIKTLAVNLKRIGYTDDDIKALLEEVW